MKSKLNKLTAKLVKKMGVTSQPKKKNNGGQSGMNGNLPRPKARLAFGLSDLKHEIETAVRQRQLISSYADQVTGQTQDRQVGVVIKREIPRITGDAADTWYNFYHSMHSEKKIGFPRIPTPTGCSIPMSGVEGAYKGSLQLDAGETVIIHLRPWAGALNAANQIAVDGYAQVYATADVVALVLNTTDFNSDPITVSQLVSCDTNTYHSMGVDLKIGSEVAVPVVIPPVGGMYPRDLLTGAALWNDYFGRCGPSGFLGGSISVQAVTSMNGSATIYGVDCNQNPRFFNANYELLDFPSAGITIVQEDHPPAPAPPVADVQQMYSCRMSATGDRMHVGRNTAPTGYNVPDLWASTAIGQSMTVYDKTSIGGNSETYAYAQIPGDNYIMPIAGCPVATAIATGGSGIQQYDVSPCFPQCNLAANLLSSKAFIVVQNTSTVPMTVNVGATMDFVNWTAPDTAVYSDAKILAPLDIPSMDFLATARVGETMQQAVSTVKAVMIQSCLNSPNPIANEVGKLGIPAAGIKTETTAQKVGNALKEWIPMLTQVVKTATPLVSALF